MKNYICITAYCLLNGVAVSAQSEALQQLQLDIQKLVAVKGILSEMTKGYNVAVQGYGRLSVLSKDQFQLHENYLNGLLYAGPAVRKDPRIAGIVQQQLELVRTCKEAYAFFSRCGYFTANELTACAQRYAHVFDESTRYTQILTMLLTDGALRMNDAERLQQIDALETASGQQVQLIKAYNSHALEIALQRIGSKHDIQTLQRLYGISRP